MGILEGKNVLVAGVTMNTSIGYRVAEVAAEQGATVFVSNFAVLLLTNTVACAGTATKQPRPMAAARSPLLIFLFPPSRRRAGRICQHSPARPISPSYD